MRRKICLSVLILLTGVLIAQQSLISQRFSPLNLEEDHYWKQKYLFTSEADWFMDPNDYEKLEMESFFASAQASFFGNNQAAGGFSTNLGPIYLGAFADLNFGNGKYFGFAENNELQIIVGTDFMGAFKPFIKLNNDKDIKFGLGWGINFAINNGTLKPEFMIGYNKIDSNTAGIDGYLNAGASIDVDFDSTDRYASGVQLNYEFRFGMPTDSGVTFHNHKAALMYQRLYSITEGLVMGWGLGASSIFDYYKAGGVKVLTLECNAESVLGFSYSFGEVFGIHGMVFLSYPVNYENDDDNITTTIGGPQIRPVLGGVFRPHRYFSIELYCNPNVGIDGSISPMVLALMATLKK